MRKGAKNTFLLSSTTFYLALFLSNVGQSFWIYCLLVALNPFEMCQECENKLPILPFTTTCLYKTHLKCVKNDESCGICCKNSSLVEHFVQNSRRAFATNSTTSVEHQEVQWGDLLLLEIAPLSTKSTKAKSAKGSPDFEQNPPKQKHCKNPVEKVQY